MTAPSREREVREAAERDGGNWSDSAETRVLARQFAEDLSRSLNGVSRDLPLTADEMRLVEFGYRAGGSAGYLRGHADATAAHAARVEALEGLLREAYNYHVDDGLLRDRITAALNDPTRPLAGSEE